MADVDATLVAALLRESMSKGQQPHLTINSNSMAPLLQRGDEIILAPVTLEQIQPGDLLTLTTKSDLLTHRYWGQWCQAEATHLLTRGDRPLLFDEPWPVECLIGRVIARRRRGKRLSLQTGWGQWLNAKLAQLATAESHWFGLHPQQPAPSLTQYSRLKRDCIWFGAKLVTAFVDFIN